MPSSAVAISWNNGALCGHSFGWRRRGDRRAVTLAGPSGVAVRNEVRAQTAVLCYAREMTATRHDEQYQIALELDYAAEIRRITAESISQNVYGQR
jgi:hypothetical protein